MAAEKDDWRLLNDVEHLKEMDLTILPRQMGKMLRITHLI